MDMRKYLPLDGLGRVPRAIQTDGQNHNATVSEVNGTDLGNELPQDFPSLPASSKFDTAATPSKGAAPFSGERPGVGIPPFCGLDCAPDEPRRSRNAGEPAALAPWAAKRQAQCDHPVLLFPHSTEDRARAA